MCKVAYSDIVQYKCECLDNDLSFTLFQCDLCFAIFIDCGITIVTGGMSQIFKLLVIHVAYGIKSISSIFCYTFFRTTNDIAEQI